MPNPDPHAGHGPDATDPAPQSVGQTATDPVCGMKVVLKDDTRTEHFGKTDFHFCSDKCQTKFKADPWFYASGRAAGQNKAAPADVQYTCPMHPEIVRDAPGPCPICGMALEPMLPSDEPSHELTDFTRRMWISSVAAVPLIILAMGEMVGLPVRDWIGHRQPAIWSLRWQRRSCSGRHGPSSNAVGTQC